MCKILPALSSKCNHIVLPKAVKSKLPNFVPKRSNINPDCPHDFMGVILMVIFHWSVWFVICKFGQAKKFPWQISLISSIIFCINLTEHASVLCWMPEMFHCNETSYISYIYADRTKHYTKILMDCTYLCKSASVGRYITACQNDWMMFIFARLSPMDVTPHALAVFNNYLVLANPFPERSCQLIFK